MRSKRAKKRIIKNDPLYKSRLVTRLINRLLARGKKSVAEKIVYGALENLNQDRKEAVRILEQAIKTVMPIQEVRSRRVGGATYQVPMLVKHDRGEALAIRWLIQAAKSKKGKPLVEALSSELKAAFNNAGEAVKKKEDTHKMAAANKAFAHFRW